MRVSLVNVNIVILAVQFNPSIVTKDWLLEKEIFTEEPSDYINTPTISGFETQDHRLTLAPEKFQLLLKIINETNVESLPDVVKRYVSLLPETPYKAVGLNFIWLARIELNEDGHEALHDMFDKERDKLRELLEDEKFLIGATIYSFKDNCRLKIDIEPDSKTKDVTLNFNFHFDVKDCSQTVQALDKFASCKVKSQNIVALLFKKG